jgi:hypothetical protein
VVLRGWLAELSSGGKSPHHPTPEQTAMVTSWAIYGAVLQWSQQEHPKPAKEFVKQVLPLVLANLQAVGISATLT